MTHRRPDSPYARYAEYFGAFQATVQPRTQIRIGDAERDAAASALGEHYAAGRLTREEFEERSERAWAARTEAELAPLFSDLPPSPPPVDLGRGGPGSSRRSRRGFPWLLFLVSLVVLTAVTNVPWILLAIVLAVAFNKLRGSRYARGRPRAARGSCA